MNSGLLNEHEVMQNVGLGAEALNAYTTAFLAVHNRSEAAVTLWHLATVLPMIFHEVSRRAILKRHISSGLRSILTRDPDNDIAQNEAIFNLTRRMRTTYPRTIRSLNCAVAWGLLGIEDGAVLARSAQHSSSFAGEARDVVKAATKLGTWAGHLTSFEYFTVLGVEFHL